MVPSDQKTMSNQQKGIKKASKRHQRTGENKSQRGFRFRDVHRSFFKRWAHAPFRNGIRTRIFFFFEDVVYVFPEGSHRSLRFW